MGGHLPSNGLGPLARYRARIDALKLLEDAEQERAAERLQCLYEELLEFASWCERGRLHRLLAGLRRRSTPAAPRGLYLCGGVGRGKTLLVDLFFDALPFTAKTRIHFHRFMQQIHAMLKRLKHHPDPLEGVAEQLASATRVICLDEFHVSDITDAMLLGRLLEGLFRRGVVLVTTSNEAPEDLYRDGLQRDRFLPAIDLIKRHMHVLPVGGLFDYRLRALELAEIYHWPLDERGNAALDAAFERLAPDPGRFDLILDIEGRPVRTVRWTAGIAWFEFAELCQSARSAADYVEIARCHQTLLLANIPAMDDSLADAARRFITLIDELYDRKVKLIASAADEPRRLYSGRRLRGPFERTASRLMEMQTHHYLSGAHSSD